VTSAAKLIVWYYDGRRAGDLDELRATGQLVALELPVVATVTLRHYRWS
jgi:hypothetical protein